MMFVGFSNGIQAESCHDSPNGFSDAIGMLPILPGIILDVWIDWVPLRNAEMITTPLFLFQDSKMPCVYTEWLQGTCTLFVSYKWYMLVKRDRQWGNFVIWNHLCRSNFVKTEKKKAKVAQLEFQAKKNINVIVILTAGCCQSVKCQCQSH